MAGNMMPFEVHAEVAKLHPKKFVEAVITDAMKILPSYQHRPDTLVVVTPRKIAVILNKQARRAAVISVEMIEQIVEGKPMEKTSSSVSCSSNPVLRHAYCGKLAFKVVEPSNSRHVIRVVQQD